MKAPEYRLYDTNCGISKEEVEAAMQRPDLPMPNYSAAQRCWCGRANVVRGLSRCQECIEQEFTEHGEEFRTTVAQGNLQPE